VKKVAPCVVTIYSTKTVSESSRSSQLFDDPFFRRFFGDDDEQPQEPPRGGRRRRSGRGFQEQSLGSGVIVTADGYILSNSHVVEGADQVKVSLGEGLSDLTAKVVGTDPPTDISVLKIEMTNLAPITISDSSTLDVGDVVLALGNPFGVGQTVTMGIVSAVGRGGFGIVDYEDFIQTDASINPGNSGGPLVDVEGRLVGINTAILSGTGGNMGVGFAVPINMARVVMDRIIKDGRVVRGFLGVVIQQVTPDLAKEFQLPDQSGALIGEVQPNAPAAEAGLQVGDVITEIDEKKVTDSRALRLMISQTPPRTKVNLKVLREGKARNVNVVLGELPTEQQLASRREGQDKTPPRNEKMLLDGVSVGDLGTRARRQYNIPENVRGPVVVDVAPDSAAFEAGLRPGDVILQINHENVRDSQSAMELSKKTRDSRVLLWVWSKGARRFVVVEPPGQK
jgi:serine protease Do